ncbi:tetratricopeptide repeat protein [Nitrospirota bacterium]
MRKRYTLIHILFSALLCAGLLASCATDDFVEDPARQKASRFTEKAYEEARKRGEKPDWDRVLKLATRAIKEDPAYPLPYSLRGAAYNAKDNPVMALHDLDRAIELSSDFSPAFVNRGISYMKLKLYDLALLDFESALELEPENITSLVNIAQIFTIENDIPIACLYIEKAVVMGLDDLNLLYTEPAFEPLVYSGCLEKQENRLMGR